jgi:hypothetical protein
MSSSSFLHRNERRQVLVGGGRCGLGVYHKLAVLASRSNDRSIGPGRCLPLPRPVRPCSRARGLGVPTRHFVGVLIRNDRAERAIARSPFA